MKRFVQLALGLLAVGAAFACSSGSAPAPTNERGDRVGAPPRAPFDAQAAATARAEMVEQLRRDRGIEDERVLAALGEVPRHEFVPPESRADAYDDRPIAIGEHQTISQPYIVALVVSLAELRPTSRVLEVGTGSGYTSAVLARVAGEVYSIEIRENLAETARVTLERLGYAVQLRVGDGYQGWPEAAPFDAIIVSAAPAQVPEPLKQQLRVGGRLVIPVGAQTQKLLVMTRTESGFDTRTVSPVVFTPMVRDEPDSPR